MVIVIAVIALAIVAAISAIALIRKRRPAAPVAPAGATPSARESAPEPAPMTGLEEALSKVTDRSGTSMAQRLDAESEHVDEFRVIDDTGPLLRRALDRVNPADGPAPATGDAADPPGDAADSGER